MGHIKIKIKDGKIVVKAKINPLLETETKALKELIKIFIKQEGCGNGKI